MADARPTRVCATTCRQDDGLKECDLDRIPVTYVPNPHGRYRPSMRLYLLEDVLELQMIVREERAVAAVIAQDDARRREAERVAQASADKASAKAFVSDYVMTTHPAFGQPVSSCDLPTDVLELVAERLAMSTSPFRGATAIAGDLCRFAEVSREWRLAARHGFGVLADMLTHKLPGGRVDWAALADNPTGVSLQTLKLAAKGVNVACSGIKAEIAVRILRSLNVKSPERPSAPLDVLYAVVMERSARLPDCVAKILVDAERGDLGAEWRNLALLSRTIRNTARFVAVLRDRFDTFEKFKDGAQAARDVHMLASKRLYDRQRRQMEDDVASWYTQTVQRQAEAEARQARQAGDAVMNCGCGQTYARHCTNRQCARCCRVGGRACERHMVR